MNTKRFNITLPEKVAEALEGFPNKSKFIAEALMEKIQKENRGRLVANLIEGYQNEEDTDKRLDQEWEDATLEGWPK